MRLSGIFAIALMFFSTSLSCPGWALTVDSSEPVREYKLLAAGQIATPSKPSTPISPPPVLKRKEPEAARIGIYDLFPPAQESPAMPMSGLSPGDLPVQINLEYDETLAPRSNMPGLSVVRALNEALVAGPRAAAIRAQLGIARANFAQATQAPNPVFFFDRGLVAEQANRIGPLLTVEPPWKLVFRLLLASRLVAQTKLDLLTQIWFLRTDVRNAYVELVVAQETQKTLEQLYDLAARLLAVTEKRFKAGAVPQLDVLKASLAASQTAVDVNVGKRRVLRAKQQLNILMGREANAELFVAALPDFAGDKPREVLRAEKSDILPDYSRQVPPLKEFIDRGLANRLELKSLAQQLKVNRANLRAACGNIMPNPIISFGKSTAGNLPEGPKITANYFTVNAEIPLSNLNQGEIWRYRATERQLHYQVAAQQNQVTADVTVAYNNLLASRKKLLVYQDRLLTDSRVVARLSRRSYEVGQSDITAALNAQQANVQVQNSYLDAVNAFGSAFADLEFATGKPLQ